MTMTNITVQHYKGKKDNNKKTKKKKKDVISHLSIYFIYYYKQRISPTGGPQRQQQRADMGSCRGYWRRAHRESRPQQTQKGRNRPKQ